MFTIVSEISTGLTLLAFLTGDGLRRVLIEMGDIHSDAASLAMRTSKDSEFPEDRIRSAITHLEVAHVTYNRIMKSSYLRKVADYANFEIATHKNYWAVMTLAVCHKYLNDIPSMEQSIRLANDTQGFQNRVEDEQHSFKIIKWLPGIFNPRTLFHDAKVRERYPHMMLGPIAHQQAIRELRDSKPKIRMG